jgi:two-component system sensor histidine kinase/response regulator
MDMSSDFYKSLIEHSLDIITVVDTNGTITYESPSVTKLMGYTLQELIGTNSFSLIHPDDVERVKKMFTEGVQTSGQTGTTTYRYKHKDGSWRHMESRAWYLPDDLNIKGILVSSHDISGRVNLESRLDILSRAVEQSPASIVITDIKGTIEYVNAKFMQVSGYTREEAIGQNPRILKSGKNPEEMYKQLWDIISRGGTWHGEIVNKNKNGDLYTEYASISGVVDSEGNLTHYLGVKEDITDRKKKDNEIQSALFHFETIVKNAPIVVWATDTNGVFTLSKGKGLEGLDLHEDEVVGKTVDDVYVKYPHVIDEKNRALKGEVIKSVLAIGSRVFETFQSPVVNGKGEITGMTGIAVDVTEQKKIEDELKVKSAEAMRLNELTIGRELKMIELKKEIEELKKRLA